MNVPLFPMITDKVVRNYRERYGVGEDVGEEEIRRHWNIERELTQKLMASGKEERWKVFDESYTSLYNDLLWLNRAKDEEDFSFWQRLLPKKAKIFEVGSGKARLITYLASLGHECIATEITRERGQKYTSVDNVEWHKTDGVNLQFFEVSDTYDVVISSQVVEHLHPLDIHDHFAGAKEILKPGGIYYFDTPHSGAGPADLSAVFDLDKPVCMHLKEYNFVEMGDIAKAAGFRSIGAIVYNTRPIRVGPYKSSTYYRYCRMWDYIFKCANLSHSTERSLRKILKKLKVPSNIWMYAIK